jgi:2-polyprenyl-6-methoxyphenol hydroxylase-like FAD-dependent oxidoreductase
MISPFKSSGKSVLRVAIAGGSIAGLGAGVALLKAGVDVHVFEQDTGAIQSAGAGLVVQPELSRLTYSPVGPDLPITLCSGRRNLTFDGGFGPFQRMPQQFTSWDAVHTMLLRHFPAERYHRGAVVNEITQSDTGVSVDVRGFGPVEADILIAADGAQSPIRRGFLPNLEAEYAGYVAWRGTVREQDMPQDIIAEFDDIFTFGDARSGGHALAYFIPGDGLGTEPGRRRLNWVWYVGASPRERDALLYTREGQQRQSSLRRGMARDEVVAELHAQAFRELHPMFARLVELTPDPFLQSIVDLGVPRTVFDRTVLIGDAAFVVRPHTAGGAAKAARDALAIADSLTRGGSDIYVTLAGFEAQQIAYGRELMAYGIDLGRRWARL